MLQRKQQALVQGSITVLLARGPDFKVHPDFPAQPRPTRIAEVTRARPAAQQIVAALSQVFLPADGTPAQSGANVLTTPQHSYVQLLHLLRTFVGKEHRVPAVDLGLVKQHAELVVAEVIVAGDRLHIKNSRGDGRCILNIQKHKTRKPLQVFEKTDGLNVGSSTY